MFYDQFLTIKFRFAFSWLHLAATPSDCKVRTKKKTIYIYIYIWEGEQREQTHRQLNFYLTLGGFWAKSLGKVFSTSRRNSFKFFWQLLSNVESQPQCPQTTCPEPYRNLKQVRVSLRLGVEVEVRHIDRAMAMAQSAPKSLHTSHISEHLYTAHTHTGTHTLCHVHVMMMAFLACSKQSSWNETKTKTKKNQKRKTIKPFYSFHARSPRNEKFYNLNWHLNW